MYMREAIEEARKAYEAQEVPIGAVIVCNGEIIAQAHNLTEGGKNALKHAEILALEQAIRHLGKPRLEGCDMYVTCEPCAMCAGAIVHSRINKLYIGAMDPKGGACGSVLNVVQEPALNHRVEVESGLEGAECEKLLKSFFKELRNRGRRSFGGQQTHDK